jgi:HlyD family secretion protein
LTAKPGRTRKTITAIAVIAILAVAGGFAFYLKTSSTAQVTGNTESQTTVATRGNLILSASGSGTLIAQTDATFGFDTSGQVTQVYVKVGDQVEAGQVLAQLDDTLAQMKYIEAQQALQELYSPASIAVVQQEIATAQDAKVTARNWLAYLFSPEVMDAEDNLAAAEQRLAEAQANAKTNPSDAANEEVKKQEKSVDYLEDKLSQAWTYYEDTYLPENFTEYEQQGRTRVAMTTTDPVTGKEVPVINGASTADTAKARNDYVQAVETIEEGELYLEVLETGVIPEGATGEKLNILYQAQQTLKDAQTALDATQLTAPISGTVTSLDLSVGEQVDTDSVIVISQLSQPYVVDAYLDEADWDSAKVGNKVTATFELLPEQTFPGIVTMVYPELVASGSSSLVHIVVQLDQSISQDLPAGTGATVSVVGGEANDVVLVPVNAIHKTDDGYAVTVIQNGERVERAVEIGIQNETYVEIKSGLDAGETVVTE